MAAAERSRLSRPTAERCGHAAKHAEAAIAAVLRVGVGRVVRKANEMRKERLQARCKWRPRGHPSRTLAGGGCRA